MMVKTNQQILGALLEELRDQLAAVNSNPILPGAVKTAVNTTFQILEILISEVDRGQA